MDRTQSSTATNTMPRKIVILLARRSFVLFVYVQVTPSETVLRRMSAAVVDAMLAFCVEASLHLLLSRRQVSRLALLRLRLNNNRLSQSKS